MTFSESEFAALFEVAQGGSKAVFSRKKMNQVLCNALTNNHIQ